MVLNLTFHANPRPTKKDHRGTRGIFVMFAALVFSCTFTNARGVTPSWVEAKAPNVVIQWNEAALQAVRDTKPGPPMVARALAIVHTCIYDAWAAYDERARGTQFSVKLRQPHSQRSNANKEKAISFAAYRAVVDLFAAEKTTVFDPLMAKLGYDSSDTSLNTTTPSGVGNLACAAVLSFRHNDGSNQLGNLGSSGVPYADYTGYVPVNPAAPVPINPFAVVDVNRWQPLQYYDVTGAFVTQKFVGAQWNKVIPFALTSNDQFRSQIAESGPALFGSAAFLEQCEQLVRISARLTDREKIMAEYWADGPNSELPPGHWDLFAQFVSVRDQHGLDSDVKLFFALTNAIFDASIVAWDAKRIFNSVRPVTAIPFAMRGQRIHAWGGPFKGTVEMDASEWIPYQAANFPTPPFPEFVSGHSTFSAAGAEILKLFTGSDWFGDSVVFPAGSSKIELGLTPTQPVTLLWERFIDAANQAGISRRYGGIHFKAADLTGRAIGREIADQAWQKAEKLWNNIPSWVI